MKDVTFNPIPKMLKGLDIAADAVSGTLGPCGRNVFVDDALAPNITNDGATIAKNIVLPDKIEDKGAYLVRNTSSQTNDDAGDGTTTTTVLLQALVHESLKRPENPMFIKNSLEEASKKVIAAIEKRAVKIKKEDIKRVALISAENELIASKITEIFEKIGNDAVITVEDSRTFETDYEIVDGYKANVGFMSPHFITDKKQAKAIMDDVYVFVSERKISAISDIAPLFKILEEQRVSQLVIVCEDIENSIVGMFVQNKLIGTFNPLVIRATGPLLEDIEAVVGAKRVSEKTGITFAKVAKEHLGRAKRVVCEENSTIFQPAGISLADMYATHLESMAKNEQNMYIKERLMKRVAQLRGGIAVLRIGAATDFEREYYKYKAEDSVKAVKAAIEEGIVEGGAMALYRIAEEMKPKTVGEEIVKNALTAPLRKIIENAGKDYTEIIKKMPEGMGYDARNDKYVDMMKAGIIDPAKVERCAVENSISSASIFITTFASITDHVKPETDK